MNKIVVIILIVNLLSANMVFRDRFPIKLTDHFWIIESYTDPETGQKTKLIDKDSPTDCPDYFTLNFSKKNRILMDWNNKKSYDGKYKITGDSIEIELWIDLKIFLGNDICDLTTQKRIDIVKIFENTTTLQLSDEKLIINNINKNNGLQGKIEFVRKSDLVNR